MNQECPNCTSQEKQIKTGRNRCGTQRYLCRNCGKTYTFEKKKQGCAQEVREKAVRLYVEGNNFRRIGRLLGVNHQSVVNWVNSFQVKAGNIANGETETIEIDDVFLSKEKPKYTDKQIRELIIDCFPNSEVAVNMGVDNTGFFVNMSFNSKRDISTIAQAVKSLQTKTEYKVQFATLVRSEDNSSESFEL